MANKGKRMLFEDEYNYLTELKENHSDPSASWGGGSGGSPIEAGTGIEITGTDTKTISLDTTPNTFEISASTGTTIEVENQNPLYKDAKLQMTNAGSTRLEGATVSLEGNNVYLNSDNAPYYVNNTTHEYKTLATTDQLFSGNYNDLSNKPTIPTKTSDLTNDSGYITSSDIPTNYVTTDTDQTITGQKTYTNNYFVTNNKKVTFYDNTAESYNQKMEIRANSMVYTTTGNDRYRIKVSMPIGGVTTAQNYYFPAPTGTTSREFAMVDQIPAFTSQLTNNSGYITGITSSDVTTALGYTPGTSNFSGDYDDLTNRPDLSVYELKTDAFSGDYNDLTNKPTIPDAVSGTNDGTNWTSLTIGSDTYGLASGGGTSYTAGTGIDITNNAISVDNTVAMKTDIPAAVSGVNDGTNWTSLTIGSDTYNIPSGGSGGSYVTEDEFIFDASSYSDGDRLTEQEALKALGSMHIKYNNNIYTKIYDTNISSSVKTWNYCYLVPLTDGRYAKEYSINISTSAPYTIRMGNASYKIPAEVSGVNNGTNWTSLTIGNDTYSIPQGGTTPSNMMTTNSAQSSLSGNKQYQIGTYYRFGVLNSGNPYSQISNTQVSNSDGVGAVAYFNSGILTVQDNSTAHYIQARPDYLEHSKDGGSTGDKIYFDDLVALIAYAKSQGWIS